MRDCFEAYVEFMPVIGLLPSTNMGSSPVWQLMATPELFTSQGLRVPKFVHDQPGLTIMEHTVQVAERVSIFELNFQQFSCRRRCAITEGGYMGWAPRAALDGDLVCVFNGSTIPFMIRPKPDGTHTFLGGCYIHDLMNGAAFELKDKPKVMISLN